MPREMKSSGFAPYLSPGPRILSPDGDSATAASSSAFRLKPCSASTHSVIARAPAISSPALTICTQVVPFMPPKTT